MYKLALSTVFLTAEENPCIQYCIDSAMLLKLYYLDDCCVLTCLLVF